MTHIYSSKILLDMSITLIFKRHIFAIEDVFEAYSENPTTSYGSEYCL